MGRNKVLVYTVAVTAMLALAGQRSRANPGPNDQNLERAVRRANSDWAAAVKRGDAASIVAPYSDDAVFVLPDGTCIHGRAEIEKMYRARFESGGVAATARIESRKLVVDGDLAYESGYGEVGRMRDGQVSTSGSRYLTVWQRGVSGEWKIIRNLVLP